jgi:polyhydroxyalkanoate synthase
MQAYLVEREAAHRLIDQVELDDKSRVRAYFATSLLTEAAAPTNSLLTNPNALAKAGQTRSEPRRRCPQPCARLRRNGGMPSQVDTRPFAVGKNLAVTPGHVGRCTDVYELIQYEETTDEARERPLVVVPPQINKYEITDLAPGRSLVETTVAASAACVDAIRVACDIAGTDDANTVGLCVGGVTLAAVLGHLAATGQSDLVNSATFLVAGLDTSTGPRSPPGHPDEPSRRRGRGRRGRVCSPATTWQRSSRGCGPNDLVWNYRVNNHLLGENPPTFDILFWGKRHDAPARGAALRLPRPLPDERSHQGTLDVLGTPVELGKVMCDTFVVTGQTDHIIPWDGPTPQRSSLVAPASSCGVGLAGRAGAGSLRWGHWQG